MITLLTLYLLTPDVHAQFEGGEGTQDDPYQVATVDQLQEMREYPEDVFILVDDIDASETREWNDGLGFAPIGILNEEFSGSLDGNGYQIENLFIDRPDEIYIGLFGITDGAFIDDVQLISFELSGDAYVGALVGRMVEGAANGVVAEAEINADAFFDESYAGGIIGDNAGTLSEAEFEGSVSATGNRVGGLIGYNADEVTQSHSRANVSAGGWRVGGLIGDNFGELSESYATGDVSGEGDNNVGGLVGRNAGDVTETHAEGNVTSVGGHVGGLIGWNFGGMVSDSWASGDVSGSGNKVGGLIGFNSVGEVSATYALGNVNGNSLRNGGLIGGNFLGTVQESFADGDVIGEEGNTGGLVGENFYGNVHTSLALGDVEGEGISTGGLIGGNSGLVTHTYARGAISGNSDEVGGLVGTNHEDGRITLSYSTGQPSGGEDSGGFIGYNDSEAVADSSYWDSEASGTTDGVGGGSSVEITDLTTAEMTGSAAEEHMEAFNFEDEWQSNESYPALFWEDMEDDTPPVSADDETAVPDDFALNDNYPNPFNPNTKISYELGEQAQVRLEVYNVLGQHVTTLVDERQSAGQYEVQFDGSELSSGVYIYRLVAGNYIESRQMMLVK